MKKFVVLDVDGVVADFENRLVEWLGAESINRTEYSLEKRYKKYPQILREAQDFVSDPNSYYGLDPIPEGVALCKSLAHAGFPLMFVSARDKCIENVTTRWIRRNIGNHPVWCGVGDKAEFLAGVDVAFIVDDNPDQIKSLSKAGFSAWCFDQPWNRGVFPRIVYDRQGLLYVWANEWTEEISFLEFVKLAAGD